MKKLQLFAFVMLLMTALSASAALNETESALVGTWQSSQNETMDAGDGMSINMNGAITCTFNNDKTGKLEGAIRVSMPFSQGGYSNSFYVDVTFSGTGTWNVEGSELAQKMVDLDVKSSGVQAEKNDAMAQQMLPVLKQIFDQLVPMVKQSLQDGKKEKILKLTADEMQLKSVEDAADDVDVYKRVK